MELRAWELTEVAVVETFEATAVTSLILSHLVNCVVDSVEVLFFCILGNAHLVGMVSKPFPP